MNRIGLFQLSDIAIIGPGHPFFSGAVADPGSIGTTSFVINPDAGLIETWVNDNDPYLSDADLQTLAQPTIVNGFFWGTLTNVQTEYSYVVRPAGSSDPADNITIQVIEFDGLIQAITADGDLVQGVEYDFIAIASNDPVVPWSQLYVCFTPGARIATARGPRPVEDLRPGDLVATLDNGLQPVLWAGRRRAPGQGRSRPVELAPGVLGNAQMLRLSPQHRVLVRRDGNERLVPVKALIGRPGVRRAAAGPVCYLHLLFERHEVILADGAPVESLLPAPMALASLTGAERAGLFALLPGLGRGQRYEPARDLLRPGQFGRSPAGPAGRGPPARLPLACGRHLSYKHGDPCE